MFKLSGKDRSIYKDHWTIHEKVLIFSIDEKLPAKTKWSFKKGGLPDTTSYLPEHEQAFRKFYLENTPF